MVNILLLVLVSIVPLIVTLITSPQDIFIDKNTAPKPIFKKSESWRLSKRGIAFLTSFLLTIILAYFQYTNTEKAKLNEAVKTRKELAAKDAASKKELAKRDLEAKKEQAKRDELAKNEQDRRDSISYKRLSDSKNETIIALAKYRLSVDEANKRIVRTIKDSVPKPLDLPFISFCSAFCKKIENRTYKFDYKICNNTNFPANNAQGIVYSIAVLSSKIVVFRTDSLYEDEKKMAPNSFSTASINIEFLNRLPDSIYWFVKFRYENSSNQLKTNNQFLCWDLKNEVSVAWDGETEIRIRKYLKENKYY
jgi:hypothetical protein